MHVAMWPKVTPRIEPELLKQITSVYDRIMQHLRSLNIVNTRPQSEPIARDRQLLSQIGG